MNSIPLKKANCKEFIFVLEVTFLHYKMIIKLVKYSPTKTVTHCISQNDCYILK